MRSCSQGFAPKDAQPATPPAARIAPIANVRRIMERFPGLSTGFMRRLIEQSLQLIFIFTRLLAGKSNVFKTDLSGAIDQHRARHPLDLVSGGNCPERVIDDRKAREVLVEEPFRTIAIVIDVDADDDEILCPELALELVEPGKGFAARRAPGRPKIQINDLAAIRLQVELRGSCPSTHEHRNQESGDREDSPSTARK